MSDSEINSSSTGISGPGFISLQVRDLAASADFYEHKVGLKRDPLEFPGAVAFLSSPIPFGVIAQREGTNTGNASTPGLGVALWLKAANGQAAYEALSKANVTIVKPPFDGPFGRTFIFTDLDGYRITVYDQNDPIKERIPPAR